MALSPTREKAVSRAGGANTSIHDPVSGSAHSPSGMDRLEELEMIEADKLERAEQLAAGTSETSDANVLYQRCFQLLKLGGLEAEIPRLVVFGQQSMGKTTLLDYIMGGPIGYSSTDTGTRQPVVIMLKPWEDGLSRATECRLGSTELNIRDLQDAMKQIMMKTTTILAEELELEIAVPGGVHAVFVDLPGIKDDSKEGAELTRSVVRTYVRNNPNDLYILVKKASDDPANWPWSLREFILSSPPRGLGLTARQTMVVGTRARDFLINEKNDVRSQLELLDRVQKRAVRDPTGTPLPLYLLELFSLSIEEKEELDFTARKLAMHQQIVAGRDACQQLLLSSFESVSLTVETDLLNYFSVQKFKQDLNVKFQQLLADQLTVLERRLIKKRVLVQRQLSRLQHQLSQQNPQTLRESIKLYLRELLQIVTDLVTGNYMIIRMDDSGEEFLNTFGGNLGDNLKEGHALALELFPQKELYDPEFLARVTKYAEEVLKTQDAQRQLENLGKSCELGFAARFAVYSDPTPDVTKRLQPGQYIRFVVPKDSTQMLGHIHSLISNKEKAADVASVEAHDESAGINIAFYYMAQEEGEQGGSVASQQSQLKQLSVSRVHLLYPLSHVIAYRNVTPPSNFRCWRRIIRNDHWIGLLPVAVRSVQLDPAIGLSGAPLLALPKRMSDRAAIPNINSGVVEDVASSASTLDGLGSTSPRVSGTACCLPLSQETGDLSGTVANERSTTVCSIDELFCEGQSIGIESLHIYDDRVWRTNLSSLQRIAGEFAETKLLNQLSLTHLGRWLKFHISQLEPHRQFSHPVLLQLMRSVKHVVDKADWEPLVADLLQANVRGGLLHLARLAACATAAALRRVLKAAVFEVQRQIRYGDLNSGLLFLCTNVRFTEELEQALESFCRERALMCANTMRELIFEQTHAIHFEMIEDFFDGCRQFERDFLSTSYMEDVTRRVREGLSARKQRLGLPDIYARHSASVSHTMIYEEVRIQFWVIKMLLAAPLTTKLYMYFIKDIKDRSQHLASEARNGSCEGGLEQGLQQVLLNDPGSISSYSKPRSDNSLMDYFDFGSNRDELLDRIEGLTRVERYIKLALGSVSKLRNQMHKQGGVDFLMRLNLSLEHTTAC